MGDFNFAPDWPENAYLPSEFIDAWSFLRPSEPGYTEDTDINLMRLQDSFKEKQVRFDRVLCRGDLTPHSIELLGTRPLVDLPNIWPSDHFGILCEMSTTPPPSEDCEKLLILGETHKELGEISLRKQNEVITAISAGHRDKPNEDALLTVTSGTTHLLAVADGHFGTQTSHSLLKRLSDRPIPLTPSQLLVTVHNLQEPPLMAGSGSTLTVVVFDSETGNGFGVNTADSTAALLRGEEFLEMTKANNNFVYFSSPLDLEDWSTFEFQTEPGDLLLLYTDGVNECHYRQPETSIGPGHLTTLWSFCRDEPAQFVELLTQLALDGVDGNPGGEDNIAIVALPVR